MYSFWGGFSHSVLFGTGVSFHSTSKKYGNTRPNSHDWLWWSPINRYPICRLSPLQPLTPQLGLLIDSCLVLGLHHMPHPSGATSLQTPLPCTPLGPGPRPPPTHTPLPKLVCFDFLPIIQFFWSIPWTFLALKSSTLVSVSEVLTSSRTLLPAALLLYAV